MVIKYKYLIITLVISVVIIILILLIINLLPILIISSNSGTEIECRSFYSSDKKNSVTIVIITTTAFTSVSRIYILNGDYKKENINESVLKNAIIFPSDNAIYLKWIDEKNLNIYSVSEPKENNIGKLNYEIKFIIGIDEIKKMKKDGNIIIW